jgi:hypothetical protein
MSRPLTLGLAALLPVATSTLLFRDTFDTVNASCGDCKAGCEQGCDQRCSSCPWSLSLTGTLPEHSTRTVAPCPSGRPGSCLTFNVTYCGGKGASSGACYRSELAGTAGQGKAGFAYGNEYWFGFSLRLPDNYTLGVQNPQEEIHFQMHGAPNHKLNEQYRNPVFALQLTPDDPESSRSGDVQLPTASWQVTARGDPQLNVSYHTKPDGKKVPVYEWENSTVIGAAVPGQWESFVYHTVFAYNDTGFVQLWRNGRKAVDWQRIGTAFHDVEAEGGRPPYMKIGVYKWGWEVPRQYDVLDSQVTFSELRVGDASSSFDEVDTSKEYMYVETPLWRQPSPLLQPPPPPPPPQQQLFPATSPQIRVVGRTARQANNASSTTLYFDWSSVYIVARLTGPASVVLHEASNSSKAPQHPPGSEGNSYLITLDGARPMRLNTTASVQVSIEDTSASDGRGLCCEKRSRLPRQAQDRLTSLANEKASKWCCAVLRCAALCCAVVYSGARSTLSV